MARHIDNEISMCLVSVLCVESVSSGSFHLPAVQPADWLGVLHVTNGGQANIWAANQEPLNMDIPLVPVVVLRVCPSVWPQSLEVG